MVSVRPEHARADLLGLREPGQDLGDDGVVGAAADRVVRRVVDHPTPGEFERAGGPGVAMQGRQRLRVAFQQPLRAGAGCLQVDAGGDDVHQHVRASAGPELARPFGHRAGRIVDVGPCRVLRERLEPDHDVAAGRIDALDQVREARRRDGMVGPVHRQQGSIAVERRVVGAVADELCREAARHVEQVRTVAVAADQVLGHHRRPVR